MRRSPTLDDVAAKAGINRVTVSVVLNGARSGTTRVSEATRKRILEASAELQYTPNTLARSLKSKRTDLIGFYTTYHYIDISTPYYAHILAGIYASCNSGHKNLLLFNQHFYENIEANYARLTGGMVDGLIIDSGRDDLLVQRLHQSYLPVVGIGNTLPDIPIVTADNDSGGRLQATYLAECGYRRVLYVVPDGATERFNNGTQRYEAFRHRSASFPMEVHVTAFHELWRTIQEWEPDALACWADVTAYDALELLGEKGVSVPEKMAVIGFDALPRPSRYQRPLTTIRVDWIEAGKKAVDLLLKQIGGEEVPLQTTMPVELLVGSTTKNINPRGKP